MRKAPIPAYALRVPSLLVAVTMLLAIPRASAQQRPLRVVAFGSCDNQDNPRKLWAEVLAQRPDLWIWGGDNIYGDSEVMDTLRAKYERQKAQPLYRKLTGTTPVTGTWDDHDYGLNDGGKEYPFRRESRELLFDFLGIGPDDPARSHEGAYSSRTFGPKRRQVKVINLDTRYFRDPLTRTTYRNPLNGQEETRNEAVEGRDILGEEQWAWLERELRSSKASINLINSSIQVIADGHRFEKWANFPTARRRLYALIAASGAKGVLLVSGDRHIAELSVTKVEGLPYPLYDLTSSGLTHTWPSPRTEENPNRMGDLVIARNFGVIRIDWMKDKPDVTVEVRGEGGTLLLQQKLAY